MEGRNLVLSSFRGASSRRLVHFGWPMDFRGKGVQEGRLLRDGAQSGVFVPPDRRNIFFPRGRAVGGISRGSIIDGN
jgi:hypothetical protein